MLRTCLADNLGNSIFKLFERLLIQSPKQRKFMDFKATKTLRVMKLTGIILLIGALHVSAKTVSQTVTFSGKDVPLEKVFSAVEKQTGYVFFYNEHILKDAKPVTVQSSNTPLESFLATIFKEQPLKFIFQNKTIVVSAKQLDELTNARNIELTKDASDSISGVILGERNVPLSGATVMIKSLGKTTLTNSEGEFKFRNLPAGKYKLQFSFVGYESQELEYRIPGANDLKIEMALTINSLDETVVKGYYKTTKRLNTGNVTTVKGEDLQKQPVSDPIAALEGRVPGLSISQSSGIPGSNFSIQLRGQNSIALGNNPLYIVDGVPIISTSLTSNNIGGGALGNPANSPSGSSGMSPFNNLNIADIESIEVLKDADATAIYGSRGANGVILITTRKGKAGTTKFDLNVYSGSSMVAHKMKLLNTQQYLLMRHEAFKNDNRTPGGADFDINGTWDSTRYTDWQKELIGGTANFSNFQGTLSGGSERTQFLIGGGYTRQGTVFPGQFRDEKGSVHFSIINSSANKRFSSSLTGSYLVDGSAMPKTDITARIILAPNAPSIYKDGSLNWQNGTFSNPLAGTVGGKANARTNNLASSLNLKYVLFTGFAVNMNAGYTHIETSQTIQTLGNEFRPPAQSLNRSNLFGNSENSTWIIEPQLNYSRALGNGAIDFLIGSTFQQNTYSSFDQAAYGFASDNLVPNIAAASSFFVYGNRQTIYKYNAAYARINYNYSHKYIINLTARRDGSSRFGSRNQFGNFGAIGAAWVFSSEKFMKSVSFLSFGKLRVSYGVTGNDQSADYLYLSTYSPYTIPYQGLIGLYPTRIANPFFGWERVNKVEGGLELGFLNDRLQVGVSIYRNRTGNQLVGSPVSSVTGFSSIPGYNLPAIIDNIGTEITATSVNFRRRNFTWTTTFNISIPRNKIVSFPNLTSSAYKDSYKVGESVYTLGRYHYLGVNASSGLYSFEDILIDGKLNTSDYQWRKSEEKKFYGGLQNTVSLGRLQLDFLVQFVRQTGISSQNKFNVPGRFTILSANQPIEVLGRWKSDKDQAEFQKFTSTSSSSFSNFLSSDGIIVDASFIRLKNVALSYSFNTTTISGGKIRQLKIFTQGQNLLTITNYKGLDPESQGLNLPVLRTIVFGIQVGL